MKPRIVLDTDTYNEVDDQFALAHLLLSADEIELEAVHAAPFLNSLSTSPEDGMEKSYAEIQRVYEFLLMIPPPPVFRGSRDYLAGPKTPQPSEAASDLVERALRSTADKLVVVAIGACTNVASALLLEPKIAERIEIIWLGGHAPHWPTAREFNLQQDAAAARVLFDSGASLKLLPCYPVASHLLVTVAELEAHLESHGELGAYLTKRVRDYREQFPGQDKEIWDIGATAWAINPKWVRATPMPSPILNEDLTWSADPARHSIEVGLWVNRAEIFRDFFAKVSRALP